MLFVGDTGIRARKALEVLKPFYFLFLFFLSLSALAKDSVLKECEGRLGIMRSDEYLWDNWIVWDPKERRYLRYVLSAPRSVGPDARHLNARLRIYSSKEGESWRDEGLLWPDQWVWSGQSYFDATTKQFHLFHTRPYFQSVPSKNSNAEIYQRIAVARSDNGIHFEDPEILFDPTDLKHRQRALEFGYDLDRGDGLVPASRDPFYFEGKIYFAAKAIDKKSLRSRPAIGVLAPNNQGEWEVEAPIHIELEEGITQLELPNFIRVPNGKILMSLNLSSRRFDEEDSATVQTSVRLFWIDHPSMRTPPVPAAELVGNPLGEVFAPSDRVYGWNMSARITETEIEIFGGAFKRRALNRLDDHSLTPLRVFRFKKNP